MSTEARGLAVVAGAGPGLGTALMRRFSASYEVVGIRRSAACATDAGFEMIRADLSDDEECSDALQYAFDRYGPPHVVIHNTAHLVIRGFFETSDEQFIAAWRSMTLSAVYLAQATFPWMVANGGGTFLVSGATASLRGGSKFAAFASAKFALRGLTQSLAREFQPHGVHVGHVNLDGIVDTAQSRALHDLHADWMMRPEDVAEAYWMFAHQARSAWSHELDLRPPKDVF